LYSNDVALLGCHSTNFTIKTETVLMNLKKAELIVIGGSAGSFPVLLHIVKMLPDNFTLPVVIVIHRQRNVLSEFTKILAEANTNKKIVEPDDKEPIERSCIYIAPQNYHLLIEKDYTFSLDYSEAVQFSRPSIDVTFESAAEIYKSSLLAILLSGANNDGTEGLKSVIKNGGMVIAQDPSTAGFPVMPRSAIENIVGVQVLDPLKISTLINSLNIVN
jgi:two-component system, chemotaxis family, protein-glutamate methylesterase/glutaminase